MIRLGFTGTRTGMTELQRAAVQLLLETLAPDGGGKGDHGDCKGSDEQFHALARELGYYIIIHPPDDPKERAWCVGDESWLEKPYRTRNEDIVNNTDRLVATPRTMFEELRSGTWMTIRYAKRIGRPLYLIWPNGKAVLFNL